MSKRNRKSTMNHAATTVGVALAGLTTTEHAAPGVTGDEGLDALMTSINGVSNDTSAVESDEILEQIENEAPAPVGEQVKALESDLEPAAPTGDPMPTEVIEQPTPAATTTAPTDAEKKAAEKAAKKAEREAKRAKDKAEREAKKAEQAAKPKRVFFGKNKVGRMTATMGEDKFRANMVWTLSDASLTGDDLKAKIDANIAVIQEMSDKVKNRATYLLEFSHRGGEGKPLNEVIRRAFEVLNRDGKLVTGDAGNYHAHLIAKPYDPKTARAAGNNTVSLLKQLQVVVAHPTEKQTYTLNPDSLVGAKVNTLLGYAK